MKSEIPTFETASATVSVDCVVQVRKMGAVTHVAFAETRHEIDSDRLVREVQVRLSVPSDKVMLLARAILAGAATKMWVMPEEEWTLDEPRGNC